MRNYILTLSLLMSSGIAFATPQYAIIVDAGSSGSRLHLLEYQTNGKMPTINDVFAEKVSPGLSSFEKHPADAGASLKKILDDVTEQLKAKNIDPKQVSISVMGTAGMRLLPDDAQQAIYSSITNYITDHYAFVPQEIATIPGKLEGIYGWLDVNYLSHTLENTPNATLGSLDMGGASTEIAFATDDSKDTANEETLVIGKNKYTIFSMSFLGLGQDQALKSIQNDAMTSACYPAEYPLTDHSTGAFQFTQCQQLYTNHIKQLTSMQQLPEIPGQTFVAYSGYHYVYDFLGAENTPDQAVVESKIQNICSETWSTLKQQYPTTAEKYLSTYCANSVYMDYLLYNTYHLQGQQLKVTDTINGKDIDWTLGALLYRLVK